MKTAVLAEGENDVILLSQAHRRIEETSPFAVYFNEGQGPGNQDVRLNQHILADSEDVIYEAEGGRSKITKVFAHICMNTIPKEIKLDILVDLDGDPLNELEEEFDRELTRNFGNRYEFKEENRETFPGLIETEYRCGGISGDQDTIGIVAFSESLEEETNIIDTDNKPTRIQKINSYLDCGPPVLEVLRSRLF